MSAAIESLVQQFETRKLSRRELVASLTALVASAASGASAQTPAPTVGLLAQGRSLNHASLAVTDVEKGGYFTASGRAFYGLDETIAAAARGLAARALDDYLDGGP